MIDYQEVIEAVRLAWIEHELTQHTADYFRLQNAQRTHTRKLGGDWTPTLEDINEVARLRDEKRRQSAIRSARNRTERDAKRNAAKALDLLPPHPSIARSAP